MPHSYYLTHEVRPDITCTFASMRRCDAIFGQGTRSAEDCRQGARDAHLLDHTFGHSEAYATGRSLTFTCPPALDTGYAHPTTSGVITDPRYRMAPLTYTYPSCATHSCGPRFYW